MSEDETEHNETNIRMLQQEAVKITLGELFEQKPALKVLLQPDTRTAVLPLPSGDFVVAFPKGASKEDAEKLKAFVALMLPLEEEAS